MGHCMDLDYMDLCYAVLLVQGVGHPEESSMIFQVWQPNFISAYFNLSIPYFTLEGTKIFACHVMAVTLSYTGNIGL